MFLGRAFSVFSREEGSFDRAVTSDDGGDGIEETRVDEDKDAADSAGPDETSSSSQSYESELVGSRYQIIEITLNS